MIKIILIVDITILFVLALCKISKRADRNAQIILKKYKADKKIRKMIISATNLEHAIHYAKSFVGNEIVY